MSASEQWQSKQATEDYQNANDVEREVQRDEFFQTEIAPKIPPRHRARAKELWDERTAPQGDPNSGILGDIAGQVKSGLWGGMSDLAQGVTLGNQNTVSDTLRQWQEEAAESVSPSMIEAVNNTGFDFENGGYFKEGSSALGWAGKFLEGVGSVGSGMLPGGLAAKGAAKGLNALGKVSKGVDAAIDARKYTGVASEAYKKGEYLDKAAGFIGYGGTSAATMVGSGANQTYQDVMNPLEVSQSELNDKPRYREIYQEVTARTGNADPDQAAAESRRIFAEEMSLKNRGANAALGFLTGGVFDPMEMKMLKGAFSNSRKGGAFKGGMAEAVEESVQSGGQQMLANQTFIDSGFERDIMAGVPESVAEGVVLGGAIGAAMGGMSKPQAPPDRGKLAGSLESEEKRSAIAEAELQKPNLSKEQIAAQEEILRESYQQRYNIERQIEGLDPVKTEPPRKPVTAAPEETRQHVSEDIDNQILEATSEQNDAEQKLKRDMKNGGNAETAQQHQRNVANKTHQVNILQTAGNERGNQKYFENDYEYAGWVYKKSQGGNKAAQADIELAQRKAEYDESLRQMEQVPIPSHQNLRKDRRQLQVRGMAERVRTTAANRLGSHQRQQQFDQLKETTIQEQRNAQSESQKAEQREQGRQANKESKQQSARLRFLGKRISDTGNTQLSNQLNNIASAMDNGKDLTSIVAGLPLNVRSGKVDKQQLDAVTKALAKKAPRTQGQHKKTITDAAMRKVKSVADRYAGSNPAVQKAVEWISHVMEKKGVLRKKFGGKELYIKNGQVDAKSLRDFIEWLKSEENVTPEYWNSLLRELANDPRQSSGKAAMARSVIFSMSNKQTKTVSYGGGRTLNMVRGKPDFQDMLKFISWLKPAGRVQQKPESNQRLGMKGDSGLETHAVGEAVKVRKQQLKKEKEEARRKKFKDYYQRRAGKGLETLAERIERKAAERRATREARREKLRKRIAGNTKRIIDFKNRQIAEQLINQGFTHIWTDPVTGDKEPVVYGGFDQDYETDLYFDINGGEVIGRPEAFKAIEGAANPAISANPEEEVDQEQLNKERQEAESKREAEAEAAAIESEKEAAARKAEFEKSEKIKEEHQKATDRYKKEQEDLKKAKQKKIDDTKKTREQIKVRSRELNKEPHLTPRQEPVAWKDIRQKVPGRTGNRNARSVPWAKALEDAYKKLANFNDELVYADENVAIFRGKRRNQTIEYVVRQPDASKHIAWAELSGQRETSPVYRHYSSEQIVDLLENNQNSAEYEVLNTFVGAHPDGFGDSVKYVDNAPEVPEWKGGWRGAVTRPIGEMKKQKAKPEQAPINSLQDLDQYIKDNGEFPKGDHYLSLADPSTKTVLTGKLIGVQGEGSGRIYKVKLPDGSTDMIMAIDEPRLSNKEAFNRYQSVQERETQQAEAKLAKATEEKAAKDKKEKKEQELKEQEAKDVQLYGEYHGIDVYDTKDIRNLKANVDEGLPTVNFGKDYIKVYPRERGDDYWKVFVQLADGQEGAEIYQTFGDAKADMLRLYHDTIADQVSAKRDKYTKPEKVYTSEKHVKKIEKSIHETDTELLQQHQIELEKAYANIIEEIEGLKEKGIHVDEDSDLGIGLEELKNGHIDAISMSVVVDELNKLRKENNIEPSRITVPPYPATSDIREGEYKDDLKKRIRSGMTQTAALESIRDNTQNSFYKILANRLLQVGLTGDIGYSEKIETEDIFSESASGQYNKDTDNVTISKTGLGRRNIEHVILHELIHAATINSLPNTLFSLDKKSTEYKLNQLYHFLHDNHPDISDHYGLKSPFELLAEGFTNPDFQNLLKKVPYQSDTAWSQFVDMVMELLGLSKDSRTALDEVMNLGEQVISEETGRRKLSGKGSTAKVAVPKSDIELEVQYKVVENKDLVASHNIEGNENPDYPSELQPRDRTRQGSKEQIVDLAGRFNPALATANPLSSDGAPITNSDNQVESGNGRTLALRNVYGSKPKLAEQYKQYLIDHASEFGLDPAVIEAMDQPQLVRERKTELTEQQLQEYLKKSNDPDIAKSSVTEQAFNDAKVIDDQMIQLFNPGSDGSLETAGNRNFLDKFYQAIGGDANSLRTKDGEAYTKQFYERLQGALFAKAYENDALVSLALEENTEGVANVLKALNVAAPEFARVKAKHGDLADLNLVAPMVDGIRVYREAKANNQAIDEYISQGDMLSGDSVPHLTGLFAQMIDANERRHKQMGVAFAELARDIDKELDRRAIGDSLFGPHQEQSLSDILNASNRLVREQNEQIKTQGGQAGLLTAGGKPTQAAESQESGRPAKTSSVEDKQRQEEGGKAKASTKKNRLTEKDFQKLPYNDLVRMTEKAAEARRKIGDKASPVQIRYTEAFYDTGKELTYKNLERFLKSKGVSGYIDSEVKAINKIYHLVEADRNGLMAGKELNRRRSEKEKPTPAKKKSGSRKKLTKPTAIKMSQYRENEQQRNHLVSGKADKKYFDRGTDRSAGGLTAAGQKKYDKLQDANDKIYGQIVKAAQQFPSEESWLKAVEAAGHDPDSWSWDELDIEPESSNNDQIAEQPAPVPMADFGEMEVPDVNKLRENNPEAAAAIAKEKEEVESGKTPNEQAIQSDQLTGSRGITEESGSWHGMDYQRTARVREIPPTPKGMANFVHNLQNGDLLIDKFGNTQGVVAVKKSNWVKVYGRDGDGNHSEYILKASEVLTSKADKQAFKTEVDRLASNNDQITEPVTPTVAEPESVKTEESVKQDTEAEPTDRQKRKRKRTGKIIEIDRGLLDSSVELTAAFKKQAGKLTSGVDPVFLAEVLRLGTKTGVLLIKKGAIKFADWADNMLAVFEAQDVEPEQVAPYLKELYGSVSNSSQITDAEADQMDGSGTVRRFDMDSLLGDEYVVTRADVSDDVMQQAEQAGRDALKGVKREDWYDSTQIRGKVYTAINNSLFTNVPEEFSHDNLDGLANEVLERVKAPVTEIATDTTQPVQEPSRADAQNGQETLILEDQALPVVEHTTKRGNDLRGVILKDRKKTEALEIDPHTFYKDGGWFIREKYLTKPPDTEPLSTSPEPSDTIPPETTTEAKSNERTDHDQEHLAGTESDEVPGTETVGATGNHDAGVSGTAKRSVSTGSRTGEAGSTERQQRTGPSEDSPVDATGSQLSEGDNAGPDHRGDTSPVRSEDYRITDGSLAEERSWPEKARDNIAAIRILKQLRKENRNARPDEQAVLVRYVGWGAGDLANNIFPVKGRQLTAEWQALSDELKSLMTDKEWKAAASTVNSAFFTNPSIINVMYAAAKRFGIKSGLTLEGGTGIGNFAGLIPTDMNLQYTGVEMDPTSAQIAQALYPGKGIINGDFTKVGFPDDHFNLAIGNPPYVNSAVKSDPKYASKNLMLHDYFIAKQIDALKPGGIGVFVTSSKTMDKQGQEMREYVNDKAHFLGAIRLPNTAFSKNAGTEVVTDIIFFQKRGENTKETDHSWISLGDHPTLLSDTENEHGVYLPEQTNRYFIDNPDMVMGTEAMVSGPFGKTYTVKPALTRKKGESKADWENRLDTALTKAMNKAMKQLPRKIVKENPTPEAMTAEAAKFDFNPEEKEDSFYIRDDGSIGQVINGYGQSVQVRGGGVTKGLNKKQQQYVRSYIPLRQTVLDVYKAQYGTDQEWMAAVKAMDREYDAFVKKNGPINQGVVSIINYKKGTKAGTTSEQTREPIISTLEMDPEAFRVAAIESYDISTNTAKKTRIFTERVLGVQPTPNILSAVDAVGATLNQVGYLDMDKVQELYNDLPINEIISELGDQIYSDPATGKYVLKDNYLSGNVKAKLQQAKNKAATDPAYQRNVTALEAVIPEDLPVSAIPTNLGGMWIPTDTIAKFAKEVMEMSGVDVSKSQIKEKSSWKFSGSAEASLYATERRSAADIMEATLNQRAIEVRDPVEVDGKKTFVVNSKETAAAVQKQKDLKEAFERWVREDGATADLLSKIYNRDFNTTVPTVHNGQHLTFPGLSSKYQLRPHQKDVAWRIIQNGNTYMAHAVGAGKTLASIVSAMELKRLGLVNKPTFVVLKSTLSQFAAEFLDAYPGARLLVANEKQLDAKNRRRFIAKIANENWDAVIMTHNSFQSIPMSDAYTEQYIAQQIKDLEDVLDDLSAEEMPTRKTIEDQKKKLIEKLEKHLGKAAANSDKGLSYEESGIDFLFIDEAHTHKKIGFPTRQANLKGVDSSSSGIASDLFMKTQFMEGRNPGKHTVLMSGTPITNTMGELFNIQRYLQPSVMEANQVSSFDAWSATFAESTTNIEMQSDGSFKPVTRLTRFVGVPGLMRDVLQVMDYVGMEQMREQGLVKLPTVNRQVMASEKTPAMALFQKELGARIAAFEKLTGKEKKQKGVDGILAIMTDGRKAAIDLRLVGKTQVGPSKLDNMIQTVFEKWKNSRDTVYTNKEGEPDLVTGSIQLIFSDIAKSYDSVTSKNEEGKEVVTRTVIFDAFKHIKQQLISLGIPASEIAFITDYADSQKKKRLFNEVNNGKKTIILGGSDNLGTGVNVQKRLTSLHNLDINYVPAKMNQRTGRGERQGNQNTEIDNYLYVTKGTTDATVLQLNENKTRMAEQVLRGDFSVTSMEDVGESASDDLAQAKAIASGNPLLMEQASVSGEYRRLIALRDAHINKMSTYRRNVMSDTNTLEGYERRLPEAQAMAEQYVSTKGDQFTATINGQTLTKRTDTGDALMAQLEGALTSKSPKPDKIGKLAGYDLYVYYDQTNHEAVLSFKSNDPAYEITGYRTGDKLSSAGVIARAENTAASIARSPASIEQSIRNLNDSIERWKKGLKQPFEQAQELKEQKARLDEIDSELESGGEADNEVVTLPQDLDSDPVKASEKFLTEFIPEHGNQEANTGREGEYGHFLPEGAESPELVYQLQDGRLVSFSGKEVAEVSPDQVTQTATPEGRYALAPADKKTKGIKPYEAKALQSQLTKAIGNMATVVQNESDLPKHLYDQIKADGVQGRVKGVYDPQNDTVYVIAGNVDNFSDGLRTALHEAVGHKGLRGVLGKQLNKTLDQIYNSLPESMVRQLRKEYANQIAGKSQEDQRRIIAEEYLAHLAEEQPNNTLVQRVIAKIRNWMRQYLPGLKWSDGDIRQLMIEASQQAKETPAGVATDTTNIVDTPDSARYKVDRLSTLDYQNIKEAVGTTMSSMKASVRKGGALGSFGGRQLTYMYKSIFDKAKGVNEELNPLEIVDELTQAMTATRNEEANKTAEVDNDWAKLAKDKKAYASMEELIFKTQELEQDPSIGYLTDVDKAELQKQYNKADAKGDFKKIAEIDKQLREEEQREKDYRELKKDWDNLGRMNPDAQKQYNKIKKFYEDQWKRTKHALLDRLDAMDIDPYAKTGARQEIEAMFHRSMDKGPYFPLMRFGDFVVIANDVHGKPYRAHFESKKAMEEGIAELEARTVGEGKMQVPEYTIISSGVAKEMTQSEMGGVSEFSSRIYNSLKSGNLKDTDQQTKFAFMDEVNQIALSMMPELSATKRSLHRSKVAGYDTNARRAFQNVAIRGGSRLSRIRHGWQIDRELDRMDQVTDANVEDGTLNTDEKIVGRAVAHEMRKRHELNMNPVGNQFTAVATNMAFVQYLGFSAAAGFVNATQNVLIALPQLGSKYGYARTARYMGKALIDYIRYGARKPKDFDEFLQKSWVTLEDIKANKDVPADEIALIQALVKDGTMETTQAHSVNLMKDYDLRPEHQTTANAFTKIAQASGLFFHNAEVMNRQVAAMTAYRLYKADAKKAAKKAGKKFVINDEFKDKSKKFTRNAVFDAHYDYSSHNRPRHFKGNWAKVLMIFKQHSQNTTFFLGDIYYKGLIKGGIINKKARFSEEAKEARRAIYGVLGLHTLFAGVMGLPGMSVILWALSAALGYDDEDDPRDIKYEMREYFTTLFGKENGHALTNGIFNSYMNVNLGSSMSANDLWWREPNYDMPAREKSMHYLKQALGPAVSIPLDAYVGATEMAKGDTFGGLKKIMPRFFRDAMKAWDYNENGVVDSKGTQLLDPYDPLQTGLQTFGFRSGREAEGYQARGTMYGLRDKVIRRKTELKQTMDKAVRTGDKQLEKQTWASIDRFNDKQRQYPGREWAILTRSDVRKSLKARAKYRDKNTSVGYVPDRQLGMANMLEAYNL